MIQSLEKDSMYEYLTLVVSEYEKAALGSGDRDAVAAVMHAPLSAYETTLTVAQDSLNKINEAITFETLDLSFDKDLADIFGEDNLFSNYLSECLGCEGRIKFDWQLKPIKFLGELDLALKSINFSLDALELDLDPLKLLPDLCKLLNVLKDICIPDLIFALISLKLLLGKYQDGALNINLDWTVILGPMLKGIVDGITILVEQITSSLKAPLSCTIATVAASSEIQALSQDILGSAKNIRNDIQDDFKLLNDIRKGKVDFDAVVKNKPLSFKSSGNVSATAEESAAKSSNFDLLRNFSKLLKDAQKYIEELERNILNAINSLNVLVSGNIGLQLDGYREILLILDFIKLLVLAIKMLKQNPDITDWCSFLEENPLALQRNISTFLNTDSEVIVQSADGYLSVKAGPNILSKIPTCSNNRDKFDNELLGEWISELAKQV